MQSGGFEVMEDLTRKSFEVVRNRAAFELRCPRDRLELVVLNVFPYQTYLPAQIAVSGCDHRAVYVQGDLTWVLNSVDGSPQTKAAANSQAPSQ
jgi:hypothetical protein